MSALAIQRAMERQRRGDNPRPGPQLRLVHDAEKRIVAPVLEPQPRIHQRLASALNKIFAFTLVIIARISIAMASYAAGENDKNIRDARARVAEIQVTVELPPMMQQIGEFDREKGTRRWKIEF